MLSVLNLAMSIVLMLNMPCVFRLISIILSVLWLIVIMLSVWLNDTELAVIMMSVVMLKDFPLVPHLDSGL